LKIRLKSEINNFY